MTIEKNYYCVQCGSKLSRNKVCKNCGYDSNQGYPDDNVQGAGYGWSDKIDDPRFGNYQNNRRIYIILFTVILIVGIFSFMLLSGDLSFDSEGIIVMIVIGMMFIIIATLSSLSTKRKGKEWIGTVINKGIIDNGQLSYRVQIKREDGKVENLMFNSRVSYDYYNVKDVVRKHNKSNLRTLEKLDKRQDTILFCPSCAYLCDSRDHFCQACGSPLLRGR